MFGTRNSVPYEANKSNSLQKIQKDLEIQSLNLEISKIIQTWRSAKKSITFLLNPHNKELDLATKEGLQLYSAAKNGL